MSSITRSISGFGLMLCVFALAYFLQANLFVNWDVSWDLLVTKRLLSGGTYTKDFFDLNPPLVFYELIPVILLERFFLINEVDALRWYVFFLSFISIGFCSLLLKQIFSKNDFWLKYTFLIALLLIYLVLPANDFGQREHLLLIFTMPYFLTIAARCQGKFIPVWITLGTGLFAALGFGIKPFFVMPFIMVELYYMFFTRQFLGWMRTEVMVIILFLTGYVACVFLFHPDYIFTVVRVARQFYYDGFSDPWRTVLFNSRIVFCYFALLVFIFQIKNTEYASLKSVMIVSMLGLMSVTFLQKTAWSYHIYPAYAFAVLLSIFFLSVFIKQNKHPGFLVIYFTLILVFTTFRTGTDYRVGMDYAKNNKPLITFLKEHVKNQSIYFLGASPREIFPAVTYANAQYGSRFLHLFWVPGIAKNPMKYARSPYSETYKKDEKFITDMLAEDIRTNKPEYIFVDIKDLKPFYSITHFDYLSYLTKNTDFKNAFKEYRYYTMLEKHVETIDQKKWDLYFFPNKNDVDSSMIHHRAIIMTGSGNARRVYVVINKKFVTKNKQFLYNDIVLPSDILKQISGQKGLMKRTKQNADLLNKIITRSILYSYYKFAVYQRNPLTTERIN